MDKRDSHHKVVLLIPEPFFNAWSELIGLCEAIKSCESILAISHRWPVLALAIKAAHTTLSIATLAAMRQWPDAWVLSRSLFEIGVFVKWFLESDTDERISAYLSEIEHEKGRLKRKALEGRSVAIQVMRDLLPSEFFDMEPDQAVGVRPRLGTVRERAQRTDMDRNYDLPYWAASVFAHSHALSLAQWNPALTAVHSPFVDMFSFDDKGLSCWMVLEGSPMSALDTFELADRHFSLGLGERIESARQSFRDVVTKVSGSHVRFTSEIERGDFSLKYEDGRVRWYTPKRSGRDPIDDLP